MNFVYKIGFCAVLIFITVSCEKYYGHQCGNKGGDCPVYPDYMIKPLPLKVGDSIRFKNDQGTEIGLLVDYYSSSSDAGYGCQQTGSASCHCNACMSVQSFDAITEDKPSTFSFSLNKISLSSSITFQEGILSANLIHVRLFDEELIRTSHTPEFPVSDHHASYELGGVSYSDVYIIDDTSGTISKIYISRDRGIIGFDETQTPSTFYLTE